MNWFLWALLSAFFAGLTAVLAKVGVQQIDSNMATAIRTVVILIFAWAVALVTKNAAVFGNRQTHLDFSDSVGHRHQACPGCAISAPCNSAKLRRSPRWTN